MAHKALIEILGNATSYLRAARESAGATTDLKIDLQKLAVSARTSADAQVKASVVKDARLRSEISTYREIGAAARKGSREQIAAANLAEVAEKRLGRSVTVTAAESARLTRTSRGHIASVSSAAERGHSRIRGLVGGAAAIGTGLLAGGGIAYGIKDVVEASIQAQAQEGQLRIAVKDAGLAYSDQRKRIDETLASQRRLGFAQVDSVNALAQEVRGTKSVVTARQAMVLVDNIARGRHVSLAIAANAVSRAYGGQTGALRRLVPFIQSGVSATDALKQANAAYSGAAIKYARSNAGAQDRLRAALHEEEVLIGNELTPTITRLSGKLATWLGNSRNQARVQRDLHTAVSTVSTVSKTLFAIIKAGAPIVQTINRDLGGTKNTVKLLAGTIVAFKAAQLINGLAGITGGAKAASGEVGLLRTRLTLLGKLGVIGVTIAVAFEVTKGAQAFSKWLGKETGGHTLFGVGLGDTPLPKGDSFNDVVRVDKEVKAGKKLSAKDRALARFLKIGGVAPEGLAGPTKHPVFHAGLGPGAARGAKGDQAFIATQDAADSAARLTADKLALAGAHTNAEKLTALVDERKQLATKIASIKAELKGATGVTRDLLVGDLTKVTGQDTAAFNKIAQINRQAAAATKAAATKAAQAARAAATAHRQSVQTAATELQTAAVGATTIGATRKAFGKLIAFYRREAHDTDLTRLEQARYAKLAADAKQKLIAQVVKDRKAAEKVVESKQLDALGIGKGSSISQLLERVKQAATDKQNGVPDVVGKTGAPTVRALKLQTDQVAKALKGTYLDTDASRNVLGRIRKVLSGHLGAINAEMRGKIQQLLQGLKGDLNNGVDGFNLAAADKRRRFLDRSKADHYGRNLRGPLAGGKLLIGRGGGFPGLGAPSTAKLQPLQVHYHYSPKIEAIANEPIGHALDRGFFKMRVAMGGGH